MNEGDSKRYQVVMTYDPAPSSIRPLAGFALSATPGPSKLYVASRSIGQSPPASPASAFGLGFGGILLAVATAFGLTALFARSVWNVQALRIVGSVYLVWLDIGMIRDARAAARVALEAQPVGSSSFSHIDWQGILVERLNPKTVLFFALFLPPFIDTENGSVWDQDVQFQLPMMGALVPLTAVPSDIVDAPAWMDRLILISIAVNHPIGLWSQSAMLPDRVIEARPSVDHSFATRLLLRAFLCCCKLHA